MPIRYGCEHMNKWVREDLKGYEPYNATVKPAAITLDANESPWNLPDEVRQDMLDWFMHEENLNRYPDTDCVELREAIAAFWGGDLTKENIVCGVGSDQLIDYITKAILSPGDVVVTTTPSFSMYGLTAKLNHGRVAAFPLDAAKDFRLDLDADAFIQFAKENNAKLVFLCTPNNPTGQTIQQQTLMKIAEALDCPIVVDEAYGEFTHYGMQPIPHETENVLYDRPTMIPCVNTHPNVIVLRTFSKAYGLAGARIGYSVSHVELAEAINIVRAPYNVPTVSQKLALSALRHKDVYELRICRLRSMEQELAALDGIKVYESEANFVYFETEMNVTNELEAAGIRVRVFQRGEKEIIRLSFGTKEQNEAVLAVIRACAGKR